MSSHAESHRSIKQDFERVIDHIGRVPTRTEYDEHGEYTLLEFLHAFSDNISYTEAVLALDYNPPFAAHGGPVVPPEVVQQDFEHVVRELDRVPTADEYTEHGEYSAQTFGRKLSSEGSYTDAVRNLGYKPPNPKNRRLSREELVADFERVAHELGRVPERGDYRREGKYSVQTLVRRFDDGSSYNSAVQELGYTPYQTL